MAVTGEAYVTLEASVVNNGVSTLAISGNQPVAGDGSFVVVISWRFDPTSVTGGITGVSWFITDPNSPAYPVLSQYGNDAAFNSYLTGLDEEALRAYVGDLFSEINWSAEERVAFYNTYCSETSQVPGCHTAMLV